MTVIDSRPVSWVCRYLKDLVETDLQLTNLWVEGEISNLTRSQKGHVYFNLREGSHQLRCVMFQRRYRGAVLEEGAHVMVHGAVSFYEAQGSLQVVADFVQPAGVGARHAEFERLKAKLEEEGLFDEGRKRPLPFLPRRIAVVTSPSGAVFHDICHVLERRWPLLEIVLAPVPVQGPEAPPAVAEAIRRLNDLDDIDVIMVARGGGSIDDLWAFNEEPAARAIFASNVPVVSAIGHETDYTIADFVADVRAPTPSAGAELISPDRADIARQVRGMAISMDVDARQLLQRSMMGVDSSSRRMRAAIPDPGRYLERMGFLVRHAGASLSRWRSEQRSGVETCAAQLRALDPRGTLARGYAVVQVRDSKQAVTSVGEVRGKDRLDIHVKDGKFPAEVSRQYGF